MDKNEIFTLWIPVNNEKKLLSLAHLSLKSPILCGHDVILYSYSHLENVPEGVQVFDTNEIIDESKIFRYKDDYKTFLGFANLLWLERLYEYGRIWMDLDIVLIRNMNEKFDDIIICYEPTKIYYSKLNNTILRFVPKNPFVKSMLKYAEKRWLDIHDETGLTLVLNTLKELLYSYNSYLKNFNFNTFLRWNHLNDYSKSQLNEKKYSLIKFRFSKILYDNKKDFFILLKKDCIDKQEEYVSDIAFNWLYGD